MSIAKMSIRPGARVQNLDIFLITGDESMPDVNLKTLEESLEDHTFTVYETGNVGELEVENTSEFEVFLQAGDLVKGGLQDRVFGSDLIVPAKSGKVPIGSFCVESGRWRNRVTMRGGVERTDSFNSAKDRVPSKHIMMAALHSQSQSRVWEEVHSFQESLGESLQRSMRSEESPSSLQLTLEDEQMALTVDHYLKELLPIVEMCPDTVLGYACAINGELSSADIYTNSRLFKKLWPRLLRANAIEAVGSRSTNKPDREVRIDEVSSCLDQPPNLKKKSRQVSPQVKIVTRETDKVVIQDTCDVRRGSAWIHRSYLIK